MTEIQVLLIVGVVAALVALAYVALRRRPAGTTTPAGPRWTPPPGGIAEFRRIGEGEMLARLAVATPDPDSTSAQRLARELADHAFATSDDVQQVVVEDATGRHVTTIPRRPPPLGPAPTAPYRANSEGHPARHPRGRDPIGVVPHLDDDVEVPTRPVADRLQLPDVVRAEVQRPDDIVDVVRAILVTGGHEVRVTGTTLFVGDTVVIVVADDRGGTAALGKAYLRFKRSGAPSGLVIHTGYIDPAELRRRDALVKQLRYAGPEAIPRMAAAVDLGLDPLTAAHGLTHDR